MTSPFYSAMMKAYGLKTDQLYDWSGDPQIIETAHTRAWKRDMQLNPEERAAKEEAIRVCILGERYWLRGHP